MVFKVVFSGNFAIVFCCERIRGPWHVFRSGVTTFSDSFSVKLKVFKLIFNTDSFSLLRVVRAKRVFFSIVRRSLVSWCFVLCLHPCSGVALAAAD